MNMPMAACQCPSGWNAVLPAFSFLWVISVDEIYQQTGDTAFIATLFPAVQQTLDTALTLCTHNGLFSAPTWNFFEWAAIDQNHPTILHNSILLVGALEAAIQMARKVGSTDSHAIASRYSAAASNLRTAIAGLWLPEHGAFADALIRTQEGEAPSPCISQHSSFLALRFNAIAHPASAAQALRNCLNPPPQMTRVGSPFAMHFLLETLLQQKHPERALAEIRLLWGRMLEEGATTCWEMISPPHAELPTRSHCHGWSASPVYLLPVIFFGIEILEPGWRRIRLSPRLIDLVHVETSLCTPLGKLTLRIESSAVGLPRLGYSAPVGMEIILDPSEALLIQLGEHHTSSLLNPPCCAYKK